MANINITIPDPMKEFMDREVKSGRFRDASTYVQLLIAEAMETAEADFSASEKERIDHLLIESLQSLARGEGKTLRQGDIEEMVERQVRRHQGVQES